MNRRVFFAKFFAVIFTGFYSLFSATKLKASILTNSIWPRTERGRELREAASRFAYKRRSVRHRSNGDVGSVLGFSKGIRRRNQVGEVNSKDFKMLKRAIETGEFEKLNQSSFGGVGAQRLANPQAAHAYTLVGNDPSQFRVAPAPKVVSTRASSEMGELYWQALTRDTHFSDYASSPDVSLAINDLNSSFSNFRGPKNAGVVTPDTVFRGTLPGDLVGPYVSQFLLQDLQVGSLNIVQKQRTALPGSDFLTDSASWLTAQEGEKNPLPNVYDSVPRYIRNGRDLAAYVERDVIYQTYFLAMAPLLVQEPPLLDNGSPISRDIFSSPLVTFGKAHIVNALGEVSDIALKAAWFQKWCIHLRLRPEEFGGRIHHHVVGNASYDINNEILGSSAIFETFNKFGSYFLPQAYEDGGPTHPAYPSGHAVIAGACVTLIKAFMDENIPFPLPPFGAPVVADTTGLNLVPYTGSDASQMTLAGELNKLASNIAFGRNWAGIHYRTDASAGLKLGEQVAIRYLRETRNLYQENYRLSLTRFDGKRVTFRS